MFSADLGVTSSSSASLYADDVFSTFLYTGTSGSLTVNNGIDLAGKGGMVWVKNRTQSPGRDHYLFDSVRGANYTLYPNQTYAQVLQGSGTTLSSTGFTTTYGDADFNASGQSYVSWTFRKAPKFFDVVTWTGDGTSVRAISHSLGVTPGLVIVKATSTTANWFVAARTSAGTYHRTDGSGNGALNASSALEASGPFDLAFYNYMTATTFTPQTVTGGTIPNGNASGVSYVAYLFADDPSSTGLIQCGSFTTDASGNASVTSLGWEPQFLMVKATGTTGDWIMLDTMRGWNMTTSDALLRANLSNAETTTAEYGNPTATGFDFKGGAASATYVYMAIRRPNKPPTSGSQVFALNTAIANGAPVAGAVSLTGQSNSGASRVDLALLAPRTGTVYFLFADRLRGMQSSSSSSSGSYSTGVLNTASTAAETSTSIVYQRTGLTNFEDFVAYYSATNISRVGYAFKRAPGFFDIVCYTGDGASAQRTLPHNLNAAPELIFTKARSGTGEWFCIAKNGTQWAVTNSISFGPSSSRSAFLSSSTITMSAAVFSCNTYGADFSSTNASGVSYVSYLFASLPGISKIGTYTGNGTTQTINCGFAAGARFVLIKRTDAAGDWYVWDTARGIVAAEDPHLSMNSTADEVTTDDSVDPVSSGFAVNQLAATNINVSAATYLYLAIA